MTGTITLPSIPAPGTGLAGMDPAAFISGANNMNYCDPSFSGNTYDVDGSTANAGSMPPSAWENFNLGAQGVLGLAGAYNAYQQTGLMEDQLALQTNMANTNLANSAATTNLGLANQANMAAQMMGNAPGTAGHTQYVDDNQVQVSGAPVG